MTLCTKSNDDYTYLHCLKSIIQFFDRIYAKRASELGPRPPTIVRTDRFKAFDSADCKADLCYHDKQASAYRHHQVAAERDIQTIVQNVAACVHTNDFIRATSLARADGLLAWRHTSVGDRNSTKSILRPAQTSGSGGLPPIQLWRPSMLPAREGR